MRHFAVFDLPKDDIEARKALSNVNSERWGRAELFSADSWAENKIFLSLLPLPMNFRAARKMFSLSVTKRDDTKYADTKDGMAGLIWSYRCESSQDKESADVLSQDRTSGKKSEGKNPIKPVNCLEKSFGTSRHRILPHCTVLSLSRPSVKHPINKFWHLMKKN